MVVEPGTERLPEIVRRLVAALNHHDLDGMVGCFAEDYVNETPAHPRRGFRGAGQVRRNWSQIFAGVPDVRARLPRTAASGDTVWTEWELSGTRTDGAAFLMRGVVIFTIGQALITAARFYLEPVEEGGGDADDHARRVAGTDYADPAHEEERS
jgi:ketosteroid isomerase-like protein